LWDGSGLYTDTVQSIPAPFNITPCANRGFLTTNHIGISGAQGGDRLGHAGPAGDVNHDSRPDIICGAPTASRDGLTENGIFYILFNPPGNGYSESQLPVFNLGGNSSSVPLPRLELHGTHNRDHAGAHHFSLGDINGDTIDDVAFGVPLYDRDGAVDRGFIGVIFGNVNLTGELAYRIEDVGTNVLPGLRIVGDHAGDMIGASVGAAGDF